MKPEEKFTLLFTLATTFAGIALLWSFDWRIALGLLLTGTWRNKTK